MIAERGKLQFLFLILFIFPLAAQTSSSTSDGYIRDWQNDGDHVLYSTENGIITSVMTADEEKLVLRKYDDSHRLTSETVWNSGYEEIASETTWIYPEKGVYPLSMTKKIPSQNQLVKVTYSTAGLETERATWLLNADDADEAEEKLFSKTMWTYDSQNRVLSKINESYGNGTDSEKTEYSYTDKASAPDMMYYENDVLVESVVRISDSSYVESLFFADMEIKSTWEDGVKTDEVYYLEGKELKRKTL